MSIRAPLVALVVIAALALASFVVLVAPPAAAARAAVPTATSAPLATASPGPRSPPSSASGAVSSRAALTRSIVDQIAAAKVPMGAAYLPNLLNKARTVNGVVQPLYGAAPAPMGIGDFGVRNTTGTPTGYVLNSTSWQAIVSLNNASALYLDDGAPDYFGIQLNTVMTNTTVAGDTTGSYWIQNVVFYSSATQTLRFIDNIWNFSNPSTAEPASTFYQFNGTPVAPIFYYDVYPNFALPALNVPYPFTVHLYENSSLTVIGPNAYSTVRFGYDIVSGSGASLYQGVYDTVLFNSQVTAASNPPTPMFTVDGTGPNPVGLLDDAEVMIGGPGGGSTTTMYAVNGTEQLLYFNGTTSRYENAQTAWDEGTDTGETVEGLSETYQTAGTVQLSPGPSIPMPFWNATPGGNLGKALVQGVMLPSNSFLFFNQGGTFNEAQSAWAPVPAQGIFTYELPPGPYFVVGFASEHDPGVATPVFTAGTDGLYVTLTPDPSVGIYTPLWAWDNAQLANESTSGAGTAASPYVLDNNEFQPLLSVFGELNDFFYPVFTGIFIDGTTAHVDINQPAPFDLHYPSAYDAALAFFGFANTNELGIQVVDSSYVSIWGGSFSGWFTGFASSIPPFAPFANVAFWGVTNSLIGDSSFSDQGSALLVALGGNNVIWGNTISTGPQLASDYEFPFELGIQSFESGDLIYNNRVTTNVPATGFDFNLYTGSAQVNRDDWNLSAAAPAAAIRTVNGYTLTGSVVGSPWQCGNSWGNYTAGGPLPYNDPQAVLTPFGPAVVPFIETGGDYCPYPLVLHTVLFTETGLTSGTWSVALAGMSESAAAGTSIGFPVPDGTWSWVVGSIPGRVATPANGSVVIGGAAGAPIVITFSGALAATMSATPGATDVGQPVAFAASPSGGTGTYTYSWAFGDGSTSATAAPTHSYSAAGSYTVNLWVNDTAGGSVHDTATVAVATAPTTTASASPTSSDVGTSVAFAATASGGTGTYTYMWDFGDGSGGSAATASHAYATAGTYAVHLTVTDAAGVTATGSLTVTVSALPTASASASTNNPLTGSSVSFTGSSTGGTTPVTYAWSFGDGATSTSQSPTHAYSAPGTYTVHLWANDSAGGSSSATLTIVVTNSVVESSTAMIEWIAALVVGLVVGAVVGIVIGRRRGKNAGGASPPTG